MKIFLLADKRFEITKRLNFNQCRLAMQPCKPRAIVSLLLALAVVWTCPTSTFARETAPVTVTLNLEHAGEQLGTNFIGLSFEASLLLPSKGGIHYFRPDNRPLINLFHLLGVKSLRIGGNTSDRDAKQLPGPEDWDSLFTFAKAADIKVIYCLPLYKAEPTVAIHAIQYIMDRYAPWVDSFSIGQEPSAYPINKLDNRPATDRMGKAAEKYNYQDYAREWKKFADAIISAIPQAKLCGPSVHENGEWAREFMADFGHSNNVALITEHFYPGGSSKSVSSPEAGRQEMLAGDWVRKYEKLHAGFVPQATSLGLPYRLEEVNNYYYGGAAEVSDTFASALWGVDFMYWWATHGASGLNFHTGDHVAAGSELVASKYTAFYSITNGFTIRPLGYAIKMFEVGGRGRTIPATMSNPEGVNLSFYAVRDEGENLFVTLINKENGSIARTAKIGIHLNSQQYGAAEVMSLTTHDNELAATQGQKLGGAEIKIDGTWDGRWMPLKFSDQDVVSDGTRYFELPPASAWTIRLKPKQIITLSSK